MKLTAAREDLLAPLQSVIGVVERRQTMPVLANVLLAARDNKLNVTGTDLEVELVASTKASVQQGGHITVPGLSWWSRFDDACHVEIKPWDVMGTAQEEALLINDRVAALGYRVCSWFEDRYPQIAARWWSYPLLVLTRRARQVGH